MFTKREKITAENKQALLFSLIRRIRNEDFELIKIKDLCKDSSVSEASFYNYFPKKSDLLVYFVQLWSLKTSWKLLHEKKVTGLKAIEFVFEDTAQSIIDHPEIMAEIISFHARWKTKIELPVLTTADKIVAYTNYKDIENVPAEGLQSIFKPQLKAAIEKGDLPQNTPIEITVLTLASIFFGVPLFLKQVPGDQIFKIYKEQLNTLWAGTRKQYSN